MHKPFICYGSAPIMCHGSLWVKTHLTFKLKYYPWAVYKTNSVRFKQLISWSEKTFSLRVTLDIFCPFPSTPMMYPLYSEGVSKETFVLFFFSPRFSLCTCLTHRQPIHLQLLQPLNHRMTSSLPTKQDMFCHAHVTIPNSSLINFVSAGQTVIG